MMQNDEDEGRSTFYYPLYEPSKFPYDSLHQPPPVIPSAPSFKLLNEPEIDHLEEIALNTREGNSPDEEEKNRKEISKDERPFGNLTHFVISLIVGSLFPFVAVIFVFGFESSKLCRLGFFFGVSNYFALLSSGLLAFLTYSDYPLSYHVHLIPPALGAILLFIISLRKFETFLETFTRRGLSEDEKIRIISKEGTTADFICSFAIAFLFSLLGACLVIFVNRSYLQSRFGAMCGLGFNLIFYGIHLAFYGMTPLPLLIGLIILEVSLVHFKRAFICLDRFYNVNPQDV